MMIHASLLGRVGPQSVRLCLPKGAVTNCRRTNVHTAMPVQIAINSRNVDSEIMR